MVHVLEMRAVLLMAGPHLVGGSNPAGVVTIFWLVTCVSDGYGCAKVKARMTAG